MENKTMHYLLIKDQYEVTLMCLNVLDDGFNNSSPKIF